MSVTLETLNETITGTDTRVDQYLVFRLAGKLYGVRRRQIQGLGGWSNMMAVPGMPRFVLGVLQQGRTSIPVIDLRHLFKLSPVPFGPATIVVTIKSVSDTGQSRLLGFLFDALAEQVEIATSQVTQPKNLAELAHTRAASGITSVNGETVFLLDTDRLTNSGVLQSVEGL